RSALKRDPIPLCRLFDGFFARPVLDQVSLCIRLSPRDADRINRMTIRQINDHPLWMLRIIFPSERLSQIRIALPVTFQIAISDAREAICISTVIPCETPVR